MVDPYSETIEKLGKVFREFSEHRGSASEFECMIIDRMCDLVLETIEEHDISSRKLFTGGAS